MKVPRKNLCQCLTSVCLPIHIRFQAFLNYISHFVFYNITRQSGQISQWAHRGTMRIQSNLQFLSSKHHVVLGQNQSGTMDN